MEETTPVSAETIAQNANEPASASVDGRSASAHSISEQIKAAQFAAANNTTRKRGPRFTRIVPPGAG